MSGDLSGIKQESSPSGFRMRCSYILDSGRKTVNTFLLMTPIPAAFKEPLSLFAFSSYQQISEERDCIRHTFSIKIYK